ncbi:MAG: hypothetical protein ACK6DA_03420 [Candidatus Kapaibacterium sp.]
MKRLQGELKSEFISYFRKMLDKYPSLKEIYEERLELSAQREKMYDNLSESDYKNPEIMESFFNDVSVIVLLAVLEGTI